MFDSLDVVFLSATSRHVPGVPSARHRNRWPWLSTYSSPRKCDDAGAEAFLLQALDTARQQEDDWSIAFVWFHLGRLARLRGEIARSPSWQLQSLATWRVLDDALAVSRALDELGTLAVGERDYARAVRMFGVADKIRAPTGGGPWPMWRGDRAQALVEARAHLGEGAFDSIWQETYRLAGRDARMHVGHRAVKRGLFGARAAR